MRAIRNFINKYNIYDRIEKYTDDQLDSLEKIVGGELKNEYDDSIEAYYAGLYCCRVIKDMSMAEHYYLISSKKGNKDSMYRLGCMYADQEKYDMAEKYLIMADKNGRDDSINKLVELYEKYELSYLIESYCLEAIKGGNFDASIHLAKQYNDSMNYDLAEQYYMMAIEKGSHKNYAMFCLAKSYEQQEKYEKAEEYYHMSSFTCYDAFTALGDMWFKQKKYESAENCYWNGLMLTGNTSLMTNLKKLYKETGRFVLVEKILSGEIGTFKNNIDLYDSIGMIFASLKKLDMAEHFCKMGMDLGDINAIYSMGKINYLKNDYKEASKYYLILAERNVSHGITELEQLIPNKSKLYKYLIESKGKSDVIDGKISSLKKRKI